MLTSTIPATVAQNAWGTGSVGEFSTHKQYNALTNIHDAASVKALTTDANGAAAVAAGYIVRRTMASFGKEASVAPTWNRV